MRTMLIVVGTLLFLGLIGYAVWYFMFGDQVPAPITQTEEEEPLYNFDDTGVHFMYPRTYTFESYPLEDETASWISLMLVRTKDKEAADASGGSEGPVAITVGIFPNDSSQALEDWVHSDSHSNFNLSQDQMLTATTVGGEAALSYEHSGLFESDAVAVAHGGSIYLFEVEWANAQDPVRSDFQNLLKTVHFN